jgi:hypothetical protein
MDMTRDEARARLCALLEPLRARAIEVFEFPDIQDACHLIAIDWDPELFGDDAINDLDAMIEMAGWDKFLPLAVVWEDDSRH